MIDDEKINIEIRKQSGSDSEEGRLCKKMTNKIKKQKFKAPFMQKKVWKPGGKVVTTLSNERSVSPVNAMMQSN